jgi:hypothetical protein
VDFPASLPDSDLPDSPDSPDSSVPAGENGHPSLPASAPVSWAGSQRLPDKRAPRPETDPRAIHDYLRLYDAALEACPQGRLAAFMLPDKLTFATRDRDGMATWIARQAARPGVSVYLHTALHALPEGEGVHRGSLLSACAAIGVFGDVDAQGPGRRKPRETLCPTVADAIGLVDVFDRAYSPIASSSLTGSGNGCYPALLFKEPLVFGAEVTEPAAEVANKGTEPAAGLSGIDAQAAQDRALLDALSRRFRLALHRIASEQGWTGAVDHCDLAKVLRPPGTTWQKDVEDPRPVRLLYERSERRYTLADLDELLPVLPPSERRRAPAAAAGDGTIVLDPQAAPPPEKFQRMIEIEPRFAWTWRHQRPDLADQSQSCYDMSLACQAVNAGSIWTEQEIVNLLIANRREHDGPPKLREDYYRRTVAKARGWAEPLSAVDEENAAADADDSPAGPAASPGAFSLAIVCNGRVRASCTSTRPSRSRAFRATADMHSSSTPKPEYP